MSFPRNEPRTSASFSHGVTGAHPRRALTVRGIIALCAGVVFLVLPALLGKAIATVFGILLGAWLLLDGATRLVMGWRRRREPGVSLGVAVGTFEIVIGVIACFWPVHLVSSIGAVVAWSIFAATILIALPLGVFLRELTGVLTLLVIVIGIAALLLTFMPDFALTVIAVMIGLVLCLFGVWTLMRTKDLRSSDGLKILPARVGRRRADRD